MTFLNQLIAGVGLNNFMETFGSYPSARAAIVCRGLVLENLNLRLVLIIGKFMFAKPRKAVGRQSRNRFKTASSG